MMNNYLIWKFKKWLKNLNEIFFLYKVFQNTPQYTSVEFVAVEFQTAVQNSKNVNASQH